MKAVTSLQADPCRAAGAGLLSWSTQMVPTPSHCGAVAHAERVHSAQAEPFIAGHERVTIQSEPRARDSHFQFWEVNSEIGDGAFEISAGERGCTFAGSEV